MVRQNIFERLAAGLAIGFLLVWATLVGEVYGQQSTHQIEPDFIHETVDSLSNVVEREYFDAEVAARVSSSLQKQLSAGRYADIETSEALAEALTRNLYALTSDKHLAVNFLPSDALQPQKEPLATDDSRAVRGRRSNFGVQRVEILAGNVGYFNLTAFYRPEEARDAIAAAFETLRHADALIIDMRSNGGGSPGTVALVISYLFDAPGLPLFEVVPRSGEGDQYSTETPALAERNETRPVYVLTAEQTFSGGEGFAFLLQERRRAVIVGETTAGAANPGRPYPVNARFEVVVPNGMIRTAVSGKNWEGVGVVPDVKVSASEAFKIAHIRALRELVNHTPSGSWQDELRRNLKILEEQSDRPRQTRGDTFAK
jgi:hypothetical protein